MSPDPAIHHHADHNNPQSTIMTTASHGSNDDTNGSSPFSYDDRHSVTPEHNNNNNNNSSHEHSRLPEHVQQQDEEEEEEEEEEELHCVDCGVGVRDCACHQTANHNNTTTQEDGEDDPSQPPAGGVSLPLHHVRKAFLFWSFSSSESIQEEVNVDDVSLPSNNNNITKNKNTNNHNHHSTQKQPPPSKPQSKLTCAQRWSNGIHTVIHKKIIQVLQCLTHYAATYPYTTIGMTMVISFSIIAAGFFSNFYLELDNSNLWPPRNSLAYQHTNWFYQQSHFNYDTSYLDLVVHANGHNVVTEQGVQKVFDALNAIRLIDGYMEGCAWADVFGDEHYIGKCKIHSIADFYNEDRRVFQDSLENHNHNHTSTTTATQWIQHQLSQPTYPNNGMKVDVPRIMGHAQFDDRTGTLRSAQSFLLEFDLPWTNVTEDFEWTAMERIQQLQDEWNKAANQDGNITWHVEVSAYRSYSDEFFRAILMDLPLLPAVFAMMSLFCCVVFWKRRNRVQSRCLLGVGAVVTIVLSIMTGYGLLFCIGVPFTPVTTMLPFLMFGIGLDDSFIIYGSYNRLDPRLDTMTRIQMTVDDVGLSISLTTITSTCAFITGVFSNIPAVKWVCMYAFPTIVIDFIYQITFFVALIVLDDRRIQANRNDICFWSYGPLPDPSVQEVDETDSAGMEVLTPTSATNSDTSSFAMKELLEEDAEQAIVQAPKKSRKKKRPPKSPFKEQPDHFADRFMLWFAKQLLNKKVQAFVILCFLTLNACSIISATQLKQEFNYLGLVPEQSYLKDYYDALNEYTTRNGLYTYVFFRDVDQSDPEIQDQMLAYVDDLYTSGIIASPPIYFWLRDFRTYIADPDNVEVAIKPFHEQIKDFFADPGWDDLYGEHVVVKADGSVEESRCVAYIDVDLESSRAGTLVLDRLREVSSRQPINQNRDEWAFMTYADDYHIWEFYAVVVNELISTTIMGVAAVSIIAVIFIPHWTAVLFVAPFISFLYIDMLGFMNISGVQINAISYMTLVMSIGLMVDYIMHILLRFYESKGTREQRVVETLSTMGASILVGAISTFLGVLLLWFSTSEIINNIFVSFIGLVCFGVLHGLIFLPVILAMVGPES